MTDVEVRRHPAGMTIGRAGVADFCGFGRGGSTLLNPAPKRKRNTSHSHISLKNPYGIPRIILPILPNTYCLSLQPLAKAVKSMTYRDHGAIEMEGSVSIGIPPLEGATLPPGFLTFDMVQERLVEAMITCWRFPDRERGWQRIRSAWPEVAAEALAEEYDGGRGAGENRVEAALRAASQTRAEVADMEEAFRWVEVLGGDDRRLVGLVITELAKGRREVSWMRLLKPMGLRRGSEGLRKRYGRALNAICTAENCAKRDRQTN